MDRRISLVTLGVADLDRAVTFYREAMGWTPTQVMDDVAFFDLGGVILGLWGHHQLAEDTGTTPDLGRYHGFTLAHNLPSREAVDEAFAGFEAAGARITKPPVATDWGGYSGYVEDPDGHVWEFAHNPYGTIGADGRIRLRDAG